MKTYKHKLFTKRDYECINVVYCQANNAPNEHYIEVNENELLTSNCMLLTEELSNNNLVKYFGYM